MAKKLSLNPAWLLRTSGLSIAAAALAMFAMPVDAFAQDGRGGGRWNGSGGQSAQSQSGGGNRGGGWSGNRGISSNRGSGGEARSVRGSGGEGGAWRGRSSGNGDGGSLRSRSGAQGGGNWANQGQAGSGQRWRNSGSTDGSTARAARMAEIERRRGSGTVGVSPTEPQWQGRNRSYSDPDRNRTYRSGRGDTLRGDPGRWNGRNDTLRNDPGRWNGDRTWRNNGNPWTNDSRRWNNDGRRWNRDWRRDNRYDWYGYRNSNRNIYRLGRYYAPYRNYSYQRFGAGFSIDSLFFSSRYWIDDPWYYRLPPADGPYRWIRYYDDALLVDIHTGEVIDVIHDFFW